MTATVEVRVPDIGDFSDIPVIEVLVAAGDRVKREDSLVTLESDKATMEVPAPQGGIIRELRVSLNDRVSTGDVIALLEVSESDAQDSPAATARPDSTTVEAAPTSGAKSPVSPPEARAVQPPPQASPVHAGETREAAATAPDSQSLPYASPSVRKFARELGADLGQVTGSGAGGRILKEDVAAFIKSVMTAPRASDSGAAMPGFKLPPPPKLDFSAFGKTAEEPLTRIQKLSAGYLHRNWLSIPHVTQHDEADITDMEAFRLSLVADAGKRGFKLTPLVFLIKASVAALKQFPRFNASLDVDNDKLILKEYFNIGIAVDTDEGLVVPVLRECERKGIMELAQELAEISARARDHKLKPQDIQGGCFSISSLGGIGGTAFTPIINSPEVAILGVSRSRMQPVWDGKEFKPRLMLPLSLSYDHRVIDGANAARFTRFLASQLEDLRRLTL